MNRERMKELADAQFIERQAGTAITRIFLLMNVLID